MTATASLHFGNQFVFHPFFVCDDMFIRSFVCAIIPLCHQVARQELEAKASKSAGESAEDAKLAAEAAAAAATAAEGVVKPDHVQIDETSFLINLIDSPGHVDFSSEVCTAEVEFAAVVGINAWPTALCSLSIVFFESSRR